ncbi:MAG: cysteine--tRNA ligase, partial [Muribaculaceae bacterium]|nr:cysteine--tRNA ligase [Muribaculaceae bacterium]
AHNGHDAVRYWMHNNMITINGQKMGKSLGNFITLDEFFTGSHPLLQQAYSPMTIRFFILQAHYRGTVDFSNEALQASEKALGRLNEAYRRLQALTPASETDALDLAAIEAGLQAAMDDDFNTPLVIAGLFDIASTVNKANDGSLKLSHADIDGLKRIVDTYMVDILGIIPEGAAGGQGANMEPYEKAVDFILEMRSSAKKNKDWATSDLIRDRLAAMGFDVKDTKDGWEWKVK